MPSAGSRALRGPACAPRPAPATATTQTPPSVCSRGISLNLFGSSQARCGGTSLPLRSHKFAASFAGSTPCRRRASLGAARSARPSDRRARVEKVLHAASAELAAARTRLVAPVDATAASRQTRRQAFSAACMQPSPRCAALAHAAARLRASVRARVVPGPGRVSAAGCAASGRGRGPWALRSARHRATASSQLVHACERQARACREGAKERQASSTAQPQVPYHRVIGLTSRVPFGRHLDPATANKADPGRGAWGRQVAPGSVTGRAPRAARPRARARARPRGSGASRTRAYGGKGRDVSS